MKKLFYLFVILFAFSTQSLAEEINTAPVYYDASSNTLFGGAKKKEIYSLDNYSESARTSSANIDVVTRDDIKRQNSPSFSDVLNQLGSVTTQNSNGSDGNVTTVRIRGTDRVRYTIDGIRADKPSMTSPGVESQFFLTDDMERVEVIKGPQGNVSGTNASGGAIAVETRRGRGPFSFELESGMGNYCSYKERFAIMGGDAKKDYYISTTWYKTSGGMHTTSFNSLVNDEYNNFNIVTNLGARLLDGKAEIRNVFRYSRARKNIAIGYGASIYNDPNDFSLNHDILESLTFKHQPTESYDYMVRFGLLHNRYSYFSEPDQYLPYSSSQSYTNSTRLNFITQHNIRYKDWNTLSIGYNFENESIFGQDISDSYGMLTSSDYLGSTVQNDVFVNDVINIKDKLFIRGGARLINNSSYGTYITPNVSAALVLPTLKLAGAYTKIRGSWGQSVNTPTLYQRYGYLNYGYYQWIGNPDLQAEKMNSWDVALEQSFMDEKLKLEFGYFNSNYKDYISTYNSSDFTKGYYVNIDSAKINGYEAKMTWEPNEKFKAIFNYTYTNSEDERTGLPLPATPQNSFGMTCYWSPVERLNIYAGVVANSDRTLSTTSKDGVPGYIDAKLGANLRLFTYKGLSVHWKFDIFNLFNQNICMYKSGDEYFYSPKVRFMTGVFLKYNLPEKQRV